MQSLLTFLFKSYGDDYKNRDGFVSGLKCKVGFATVNITKAKIKGQIVYFKKIMPWSLSFGSCSQKKHHKFLEDLKAYILGRWQFDFDELKKEWELNEHLI